MVETIVGASQSDEGKGKITDFLAEASGVVICFQGGANAGYTIICDYGKFAFRQLPSGVLYPRTTGTIDNGVTLGMKKSLAELKHLADDGIPAPHIIVDQYTQLLMSYHVPLDNYEEEHLAGAAFDSTRSGIAPSYSSKYAKIGIQVADLCNEERLMGQLEYIYTLENALLEYLYHKPPLESKVLFGELTGYRATLEPYVGDVMGFVHRAFKEGRQVLLEGQLGSMKDPNPGIRPMTTSFHTLAGLDTVDGAVPPTILTDIITVTRAYSSTMGVGTFASELFGAEANEPGRWSGDAGKFGATADRPHRVGWFDAVAVRCGHMMQGATQAALTAIGCLGYLDETKMYIGYEIGGKATADFPAPALLNRAKSAYETLPGWRCDTRSVADCGKLPQAARGYMDFTEKHIEAPITIVSTDPKRHEICRRAGNRERPSMRKGKGKPPAVPEAFLAYISSVAMAMTAHECLPRVLGLETVLGLGGPAPTFQNSIAALIQRRKLLARSMSLLHKTHFSCSFQSIFAL